MVLLESTCRSHWAPGSWKVKTNTPRKLFALWCIFQLENSESVFIQIKHDSFFVLILWEIAGFKGFGIFKVSTDSAFQEQNFDTKFIKIRLHLPLFCQVNVEFEALPIFNQFYGERGGKWSPILTNLVSKSCSWKAESVDTLKITKTLNPAISRNVRPKNESCLI